MFDWPDILVPSKGEPELRNFTAGGPKTGSGRQQTVFRDAGHWELEMGSIALRGDPAKIRAYRALIGRLRQGEAVIAPICDRYRRRGRPPMIAVSAAPVRATLLQFGGVEADLDAGDHFSIGDRLYLVTDVLSEVSTNVGLVTGFYDGDAWSDADIWIDDPEIASTVKFLPPLREAVAAGTVIDLDNLRCLFKLKEMADGDLDLKGRRLGAPSLTLIETI